MAKSAGKFEQDATPGNVDSPAIDKPNLAAVPDGRDDTPGLIAGKPEPTSSDKTETQPAADDEDDTAAKHNQDLNDTWSQAKADDETAGNGFFKHSEDKPTGVRGLFSRRRAIGLGIAGCLFAVLFGLVGFLSSFKLDHILSNIDEKSFARMNGSLDVRNTSYIRTYMTLRLADICPNAKISCAGVADSDNLLFRTNKVKRGDPLFNWYRTMRLSNFEQDVFNKHGIFLTSQSFREQGQIKFRTIKITINGQDIPGGSAISGELRTDIEKAFASGKAVDWARVNSSALAGDLDKYVTETFTSNSQRRGAIKKLVYDNTQWYQVFQRRHLRKDIANVTGVNKWQFFDNTRTKIDAKKIQIRNKIIDAATPNGTSAGRFINCLFGISSCASSGSDPANPSNQNRAGIPNPDGTETLTDPNDKNRVKTIDHEEAARLIKGAATKAFVGLNVANWASTINSLARVDKAITNHTLSGQVAVARGTQAMALYQTFKTARDQLKTGEINGDELNQFMQMIGAMTAGEAWIKTVNGSGNPGKLADTKASREYCQPGHIALEKEFAYQCPSGQIGSGETGAANLEEAYMGGVGQILHPILKGYKKAFGWIGDAFDAITGPIFGAALKIVPSGIVSKMEGAVEWAGGRLAVELGAMPIINDSTTSGQMGNWLVQGAAYSAESVARASGAVLTTVGNKLTAQGVLDEYQHDQTAQQSLVTRYLSPSNPHSLVAGSLFALGQLKLSSISGLVTDFGSIFKTIASAISLPFTHHALAAPTNNGYAAAAVANIRTYDFPPQCYNIDPLDMTPQNGTNIQTILGRKVVTDKAMANLSWDTVTNSQKWYDFVYSFDASKQPIGGKKEDVGLTKAQQIYNCNLLDNTVRGGLGFAYGYTEDNGEPETSQSSGSGATSTAGAEIDTANLYKDSTGVACAPGTKELDGTYDGYTGGQKVPIKLCIIPGFPSTSQESHGGYGVLGAGGNVIVNSRASGAVLAMLQAAKNDGVSLTAISSFRTMAHQQALCKDDARKYPGIPNCETGDHSRVAEPGDSNHQAGLAIDFGGGLPSTPGPIPGNAFWEWLSKNAASFGYKNYPAEAWHWSPSGN